MGQRITQTSTGARVKFFVNDAPVAFANAVTYTVTHVHQPVDVLDQLAPAEYAETGYTVSFTATLFRVPGRPTTGALRPKFENILRQPELKAQLIDQITGEVIFTIERVKCTQEDFNIDARNLGQQTLSFVGIVQRDEAP